MPKTFNLRDVPDDLWEDWTNSFPRNQPINDRLIQLIEEDAYDDQ